VGNSWGESPPIGPEDISGEISRSPLDGGTRREPTPPRVSDVQGSTPGPGSTPTPRDAPLPAGLPIVCPFCSVEGNHSDNCPASKVVVSIPLSAARQLGRMVGETRADAARALADVMLGMVEGLRAVGGPFGDEEAGQGGVAPLRSPLERPRVSRGDTQTGFPNSRKDDQGSTKELPDLSRRVEQLEERLERDELRLSLLIAWIDTAPMSEGIP
jgi:hypothetical protein